MDRMPAVGLATVRRYAPSAAPLRRPAGCPRRFAHGLQAWLGATLRFEPIGHLAAAILASRHLPEGQDVNTIRRL